jgi:hypothetical protein
MTVATCRGWLGAAGVEGTLNTAVVSLIAFAGVGALVGHIAQSTIDESVRAKLERQLNDKPQSA